MSDFLSISPEPLDVGTISSLVSHETCGAISLFVGTTRNNFEGKNVQSLEYEAYEPMAKKELKNICMEMRSLWKDIVNIAIYHRLGLVPPKEASVVIAISSPHRQSSLDAVSYAIEHLKQKVPIWKKELYSDGDSDWKENKECAGGDSKKANFVFSNSKIQGDISVPKELVQITASKNEIKKRIICYLEKKRNEINENNIMDYSQTENFSKMEEGQEQLLEIKDSCARVSSTIVKQESSKCLLKVCRAKNLTGPQIRPDYFKTLDMHMKQEQPLKSFKKETTWRKRRADAITVKNRLDNIEKYLFSSSKFDLPVSVRIKQLEDRLLHLESLSPEYLHFIVVSKNSHKSSSKELKATSDQIMTTQDDGFSNHKIYTVEELNSSIQQIQNNVSKESA
ncbi:unnamed protein product [Ceratitis capitata]|uniref:Molybdopterin synthase catalytic subunit n=1 Tax=Ceratitis capitata TaxID=7213 RepID=A0A811U7F2_CERCA|nr:unnamed protein product [Ceratitis capitata]